MKWIDRVNSVRLLTGGNAACIAVVLLQNSLLVIVSQCIYVSALNGSIHISDFSCWCVHSSTISLTALSLLISLRGSWFCPLEESPYAVKTVAWVNLSVSQKNRLLGDITLLYLAAHWLGAVILDPVASHFIPIYHRSTHPSTHINWLFFLLTDRDKEMIKSAYLLQD